MNPMCHSEMTELHGKMRAIHRCLIEGHHKHHLCHVCGFVWSVRNREKD